MHVVSLDGWRDVLPEDIPAVLDLMKRPEHEAAHPCSACGHRWVAPGMGRCYRCQIFFWDWSDSEAVEYDKWKEAQREMDERKLRKRLTEQGFTIEDTKMGWRVKAPNSGEMVHFHPHSLGQVQRTDLNILKQLTNIGFNPDIQEWRRQQRERKQIAQAKEREAAEAALKEVEAVVDTHIEQAGGKPTEPQRVDGVFFCHICPFKHHHAPTFWRHMKNEHDFELSAEAKAERRRLQGLEATRRYAERKKGGLVSPRVPRESKPIAAKASTNGRPAAGPVTSRTLADDALTPLAKAKRLEDRIRYAVQVLSENTENLVTMYVEQGEELASLRGRMQKMEKKLAGLVDLL